MFYSIYYISHIIYHILYIMYHMSLYVCIYYTYTHTYEYHYIYIYMSACQFSTKKIMINHGFAGGIRVFDCHKRKPRQSGFNGPYIWLKDFTWLEAFWNSATQGDHLSLHHGSWVFRILQKDDRPLENQLVATMGYSWILWVRGETCRKPGELLSSWERIVNVSVNHQGNSLVELRIAGPLSSGDRGSTDDDVHP